MPHRNLMPTGSIQSRSVACAWRHALTILFVLLLLPTAGFALSHEHPLNRFEDKIKTFEAQDLKSLPKPGGTVFIGSSTFVHWRSLEADLKEFDAINRGFGGSTIPEVNYYTDRLVLRYKPSRVVFYAGTNDLAAGHSAKQVCDDFVSFYTKVHKGLPKAQIYFISMSVAPIRLNLEPKYEEGNALVRKVIEKTPYLHYIDVTPVMHSANGKLKNDYFLPDKLHMTTVGYDKWTPLIKDALTKNDKTDKTDKSDKTATVGAGDKDAKTDKNTSVTKDPTADKGVKADKDAKVEKDVKTNKDVKTDKSVKVEKDTKATDKPVVTDKLAPADKAVAPGVKTDKDAKSDKDPKAIKDFKTGK